MSQASLCIFEAIKCLLAHSKPTIASRWFSQSFGQFLSAAFFVLVPSSQKLNTTDAKTISPDSNFKLETASRIKVLTDLYQIEIDTAGGDIRRLLLNNHLADNGQDKFLLLDDTQKPLLYVAQSGLIGNDLPTHKSMFTSEKTNYVLESGQNHLDVKLNYKNQDVEVVRIISFDRDSYQIGVRYEITNHSKIL